MSSSHICITCRRKLARFRIRTAAQWLPRGNRASFISLTNPQITKETAPKYEPLELGDGDKIKRGRVPQALLERRTKVSRRPSSQSAGDQLESLFEETLNVEASTVSSGQEGILEPYKNAEVIKKMIADDKTSVADTWQFFLEHFGPEVWKKGSVGRALSPSYRYGPEYTHIGNILLKKIMLAKKNDRTSTTLPTYTEVSRVYFELGILHGTSWAEIMFELLQAALKCTASPMEEPVYDKFLTSDILGCWNVVFRQVEKGQKDPFPDPSILDWSRTRKISTREIVTVRQKRGVPASFHLLAPIFPIHQLNDIPLIAVATFVLLKQEPPADIVMARLLSPLSQLIAASEFKIRHLAQLSHPDLICVRDFVIENWSHIKDQAIQFSNTHASNQSPSRQVASVSEDSYSYSNSFLNKRLQDALARRDSGQVDKLWSEVMHYPVHNPPGSKDSGSPPPHGKISALTFNYFIMVYMTLRQPDSAIHVWNHMVKSGIIPDLTTWNQMLSGCQKGRDPKALEATWAKMQAMNVQPDIACWTTRIGGLLDCRRIDEAIRALDEMGRLWMAAVKKKHGNKKMGELQSLEDVEGAIKPTIITVNAAISGLLRRDRADAAHRVLGWAGNLGIRPDIITYNTLLRPLVRHGNLPQAMALLRQMQRDGIQADVVTFTTILEETFRASESRTLEEQQTMVSNVFSEMETVGIKANQRTYGRIIYQLLLSDTSDLTVVNAVMARMARDGIQPGAYIYTMLVEYYFSRQPPDLDAVRALIDRVKLEIGSVDHVFWDRVIEGYASVGETATAVRILGKVTGPSMKIGWIALQQVLTSLAQNEEWDVAKTVVKNAKLDSGGPLADDVKGREGQHGFWKLATEMGLMDE